jgi:hypothetical protein
MRTSTPSAINTSHVSVIKMNKAEKPIEVGKKSIEPLSIKQNVDANTPTARYFATTVRRMSKVSTLETLDEEQIINPKTSFQPPTKASSASSSKTNPFSVIKLPRNKNLFSSNTQSTRGKTANTNNRGLDVIELDSIVNQRPRNSSVSGNVSVVKVKRSLTSAKSM